MNTAYVVVGSNREPRRNIARGIACLQRQVEQLRVSRCYHSADAGGGPDHYVNLALALRTHRGWDALEAMLKDVEQQCSRRRQTTAVTLDLDRLLLFDDDGRLRAAAAAIEAELAKAHVLAPLAELLPDWICPGMQQPLAGLWRATAGAARTGVHAVAACDAVTA